MRPRPPAPSRWGAPPWRARPRPRSSDASRPRRALFALAAIAVAFAAAGAGAAHAEPERVAAARARKMTAVRAMFDAAHLAYPPKELFLRAFKKEGVVELWGGDGKDPLVLVKSYAVCASSGELGPKHKQGDLQVPEGFYAIDAVNPWSSFHLSLHVDYPNAADRARGRREDTRHLGGAIMVHGDCVTIGCIPLEDDPIEEVYLAVSDFRFAHARPRKVPIHIFPERLDDPALAALLASDADDDTKRVWEELAAGYRAFEDTRRVPRVTVDKAGRYVVHPR